MKPLNAFLKQRKCSKEIKNCIQTLRRRYRSREYSKTKTEKDVQQLGIFEQNINSIKLIEWAEIIKNKPVNRLEIYMSYEEKLNSRKIDFKGFGSWKEFNGI